MRISGLRQKEGREEFRTPLWVVLICLATLVFGVGGHSLWTPDEPREAEIAREMAAVIEGWVSGDDSGIRSSLVVPYLAGEPFVEKPPLYYWLSALMMLTAGRLTGITVAARTLSAVCGALTLGVLWLVLKDYLGRSRAGAAVLILVTTAGFFQASHWILIDPLLTLLITAAVLFLFRGFDRDRPFLLLAGYLAAGLAFLTKGLVAGGLLAGPGLMLLIIYRRTLIRRPFFHLAGVLLLVGPGLAWAFAFYSQGGPELWREWFINNQVGRFSGQTTHSHERGLFYYFGIAPVMLLPWTPLLLGGVIRRWKDRIRNDRPGGRALLKIVAAWAIGGFVLLSLASTKRTIYLYPLLPGFAVLVAFALHRTPPWVDWIYRFICPILMVPVVLLTFLSPVIGEGEFSIAWKFKPAVFICAIIGIFIIIRLKNNLPARIAAVTGVFYLTAIFAVFPLIDLEKNYEPATRLIAQAIPAAERGRICGWHIDETTRALFSYYTRLTIPEVRDKFHPRSSLKSLRKILKGEDPRYDLVVTLLKRHCRFPPAGIKLKQEQIIARQKMGSRRTLLLIRAETR